MLVARPDPAGHHLVTAGWRGAGPRPGHPRRPSVDRAVVTVTGGTTSGKRATASGAVAGAGELTYLHGRSRHLFIGGSRRPVHGGSMPTSYREGVILAPKSVLEPGEIERLNAILHDAGLGRPLQPSPMDRTYETVVLALAGADPLAVRDALRRESPFAEEVTDWPVQVPISRPEPVKGERDHRGHGTFIA